MEGSTARGSHSYCAHIGASPIPPVHRPLSLGPHLLLVLNLHCMLPWLLLGLFCYTFLRCLTTPLPRRFSPTLTPQQLFLQGEIVIDVHTVLLLLLSLCLQLAATICSCCWKWRVGVLGCAMCKYSNQKIRLPKPLGRTKVLLQQQRVAMGVQWA